MRQPAVLLAAAEPSSFPWRKCKEPAVCPHLCFHKEKLHNRRKWSKAGVVQQPRPCGGLGGDGCCPGAAC